MASPAGANSGASSSRGTPLPLPFPFPAAAHFPSRGAGPFLSQHHQPPAASEGDDEVEEDEGSMDDNSAEKDDAELSDGGARGSPQRRAFSAPGIGRTEMNGEIGVRSNQEGQQWHQFGLASPGGDDPGTIPRDMRAENGYGVVGRREGGPASSYWDLLRAHLSDPLTGILMDDAMILSCGHSYGSSGMQHVYRMKACGKCGLPITEASIRPNLVLRLAVQAFKREEDSAKSLKRRTDRLELDKCGDDDPNRTELASRGKGVQFPFAVFDRVIIKGNKRTPERFVGHQAVVTAQCLNGWYVVKTSDNAECVKLQYRSLAKVADGNGPSGLVSSNAQSSSWL
ncbi:U-box domain-containing protein 62-like isoform X1 [Miscanthus floridulus]|uniref:U-box domain-containing protein 62-like isoform X1 n=1 Tax=Miscanthus floridulus TaxID=154761 RepID=UPI00345AAD4C